MLSDIKQHKWSGVSQHIDRWLEHRTELLTHYCKIANLPPYEKPDNTTPTVAEINAFCADLVDYVCEGHFEIYEEIISTYEEGHHEHMSLNNKVVPEINKTTDQALAFNDKYSEIKDEESLTKIDEDLSVLGEVMELRFEMEDLLLEKLNKVHN